MILRIGDIQMKKPFKIGLWLIGILSLCASIAALVIGLLINPNEFKTDIAERVKQQTGRIVELPGDLKLSLWPIPSIKTGGLLLRNTPLFNNTIFAEIAESEVHVKWRPLLSNQVELSSITLRGLTVNLTKNKQGDTNWADLIVPPKAISQVNATTSNTPPSQLLTGTEIHLEQGHILWTDEQTPRIIDLTEVQLHALNVTFDQPVALTLSFNANTGSQHKVDLNTQVLINNDLTHIDLQTLNLNTISISDALPSGRLTLTSTAKWLKLDLPAQTLRLEGAKITTHNLTLNAEVNGTQITSNPDLQGTLQVTAFNPKEFLQQQKIPLPALQDPTALTSFAADLTFQATDHSVLLNTINAKLDQTTLKGSAELLTTSPISSTLNADIDTLNIDRYFPPKTNIPTPMLSSAMLLAATDQAIQPFEQLKKLALNGKIIIHQFSMNHLDMQEVSLDLQSKAGEIHTQQSIKQLYQGSYQGNAALALVNNQQQLKVDEKINNLNLAPFLTALTNEPRMTGTMTGAAHLNGQGTTLKELTASLAGDLQFQIANSTLKGFNLQWLLDKIKVPIAQSIPAKLKTEPLLFNTLSGTATIQQGILSNDDLSATAEQVTLNGEGIIDLNRAQMAYKLKTHLRDTASPIKALKDSTISLSLDGALSNPTITLDSVNAILGNTPITINQRKTVILEKVDNALKKNLGVGTSELLKKLF